MLKSTKLSSWRILSLAVLLSATCANGYPKSEAWRLDIRYEPWPCKYCSRAVLRTLPSI